MVRIIKRGIWIWSVMLLSLLGAVAPRAMIIFDASGSMWGQIDGVNKIVIARDALKSVVRKWNPEVELGLTVYGHRVKGDCNDIQTVIPIGRVNKKRMIDTVYSIMPKGMTPIAKSLRQVAGTLRQNEGTTTIILISDGRESCDADPCVTAKQLKAEGINFVAHVVGFNVNAQTDRQLACIAHATGGAYFSAKNAAALNKAIKVIAKKVAKPKPKPKPKPAMRKPKNNVAITASARKDGAQIEASFEIYSSRGKKLTDTYKTYIDKPRIFTIPVGKYRIKMHRGDLKKEAQFAVPIEGVVQVHIILGNTGKVSVTASETEGGKWVYAQCRAYNSDETDSWGVIPHKNEAGVEQLPVGTYTLKCSYNAFKKELPFAIKAGETTKIHVVMGSTGKVSVTASETEGGKWVYAHCRAYNSDETNSWGVIPHKNEAGVEQLPVGTYTLKCSYNAFKKELPFAIKAGETTKIHVIMGSTGKVEVTASETKGGKWVYANCRAYNSDKTDSWYIAPRKQKAGTRQLPVGQYTLECNNNALKQESRFSIQAGETTKIHVLFASFKIIPKCAQRGAVVRYEVYAGNGHMVFEGRKSCSKPLYLTLDAGSYSLEATVSGHARKVPLIIEGGRDSMNLDLTNMDHAVEIQGDKPVETKSTAQNTAPQPSKPQTITMGGKELKVKGIDQKDAQALEGLGKLIGAFDSIMKNNSRKKTPQAPQIKKQSIDSNSSDTAFEETDQEIKMFTK